MKLLHSYQYIPNNTKYKIVNNTNNGANNITVVNSKGDILFGLKNIPINNKLYSIRIEKIKSV